MSGGRSRLLWKQAPPDPPKRLFPLTEDRPESPGTELTANAEQTEPTDLAPDPSTDVPADPPAADEAPAPSQEEPEAAPSDPPAPAPAEAEAEAAEEPSAPAAESATTPAAEENSEPPAEEPAPAAADAREEVPSQKPPPGAGPVIIGTAPEPPPLPTKIQRAAPDKPQRPRRRRVNATQRHRNIFFARLNDFRRSQAAGIEAPEELDAEAPADTAGSEPSGAGAPPAEAPVADAPEPEAAAAEAPSEEGAPAATEAQSEEGAPAATAAPSEEGAPAATEAPSEEAAPAAAEGDAVAEGDVVEAAASSGEGEAAAAEGDASGGAAEGDVAAGEVATNGDAAAQSDAPTAEDRREKRRSSPPPPIDRPRLIAAIERAGGEEVLREALAPKRDENGQPLKWATVCADACKGLKPGDPVFGAWVRLAATPVSAIKNEIGMPRDERRGGRGGPRRGGPGGDRGRPRRDDRPGGREGRGGRGGDRVSREDLAKLATDGRVGANIRIIGLDDDDKKAREKRRKDEREAKRQAERERLSRLGY